MAEGRSKAFAASGSTCTEGRTSHACTASAQRPLTFAEELANAVTHGFGLVLSTIGVLLLIAYASARDDPGMLVSCSVFGGALVLMYGASTAYHSLRVPRLKRIMRVVDHVAIFLLIAGTYTPFLVVHFEGTFRLWFLVAIWGLAVVGTVFKLFCTGRYMRLSTLLYLVMGWISIFAVKPLMAALPLDGLLWLLAGGLSYTFGVVFFVWETLPYNHTIWHLFVLGGSACHYVAVAFYVVAA